MIDNINDEINDQTQAMIDNIQSFIFNLLPMAPVGFKETLDGWLPPVSSAG